MMLFPVFQAAHAESLRGGAGQKLYGAAGITELAGIIDGGTGAVYPKEPHGVQSLIGELAGRIVEA